VGSVEKSSATALKKRTTTTKFRVEEDLEGVFTTSYLLPHPQIGKAP